MADMTLEEALAAATVDEELVTPVNEVLLINPETRSIHVPDSEKLFGVRQDMSVERKYFKCPRIVGDNIDLFEHYVFVNYIPSDQNGKYESEKDVQGYWCKDLAVEGDFITFSWELTENVLRKAGYIAFAVYAKVSDENGNLKTKWHTTIAIGNVLDTLPDGEEWITIYPDIVTQLLERMDAVEKIANPESMQEYIDDYFNRNPMMIDRELKDSTKAAPADIVGKLSEDIADIKQNGTGTGNGLTIAQRNSLVAVVNAIGIFNVANGQELIDNFNSAWKITINATGVTLDKTTLTFVESVNQTLVATVEPSDSTDEVMWASSNESIAKVTNGIVTPISNGSCTITATAGSVSASCEVTVNVESVIVTYTVVNNLTNVSTDNPVGTITENSGYTATLTPTTDYEFDSVVVTMGGVDVTSDVYANGAIVITSVTGNIVITASAKEIEQESGEVTLLKNIAFDGTSYLDTEVIPMSLNYRYVFGLEFPNDPIDTNGTYIGGISMRNNTDHSKSNYWDLYWFCDKKANNYNTDVPYYRFYAACGVVITSDALHTGADKGDGLSSQPYMRPLYYNIEDGLQNIWLDEELTQTPTTGHFASISKTYSFTNQTNYTDDEHPIDSIWLGKVHVTGIMNNYATEASTYAGMKFYCFKVYDENNNLIADMHPAKQGSTIGMYCDVREKFFAGTGILTYEELEAA